MAIAINVKVYMRDGWFIPVPIKVGIIHVLVLLSTAMQEQVMELPGCCTLVKIDSNTIFNLEDFRLF